jgi:murein DD-endopeptidase MepM/ murein hydrolase activator NlpD
VPLPRNSSFRFPHALLFMLLVLDLLTPRSAPAETAQKRSAGSAFQILSTPVHITNGSPCLFEVVTASPLESLTGTFIGHEVRFFRGQQKNTWYGFAGVDVETVPGSYALDLLVTQKSGEQKRIQRQLLVGKTIYPKVTLHVPEQFVAPSPEQQQQIERDKTLKAAAFAEGAPLPQWSGDFSMPVEAEASDSFGTARVFNGKVASVHRGTDFRVISGTPVRAANDGQVVLASPLFFEGNCIVLDHGEGLKTIYMHLLEIQVKDGERVKKGQVIALSGGTGRATGPHLHLAVRWQGAYLDPTKLLKLQMPEYADSQ